ncbi:citramalate synthase [Allokutzneria sp. NRRL B-24872]|uniref:citramalate synthase n=1 Tax=Allokutzneria sp. NRRL B-24872 TaxID=1137961 RepID=UPI000A360ADF|nr:citramalate synthase [Allokutzneria sp. NRRL B-24872]
MPRAPLYPDEFHVYDTTLRDGAQREGVSYSVADKLAVAHLLDDLGVGFIEGGWPGALPKDTEFFARVAAGELRLRTAQLVAFGSTRRADLAAHKDPQVLALLDSMAPVVTLVAKSDRRHIERALRVDVATNLAMISDTVRLLASEGRRVFLDAEHFFDGFAYDPDTALRVLEVAVGSGAEVAVLCDTNGGQLPLQLAETVCEVLTRTGFRVGIHCQDDTGCAVANTLAAVEAGASHVQCTANGYGERAGNADLFAVIGNLVTKLDLPVVPQERLSALSTVSRAIAELANISPDAHQPYVGASAFTHKAGLHASAIVVDPLLYNHISPETVGNTTRVLVTEMAGRASLELKSAELGVDLSGNPAVAGRVARRVKELEARGWSFEAADASLELLLTKELDEDYRPPFEVESYQVVLDHRPDGSVLSQATVSMRVASYQVVATARGSGPVEALDAALRKALAERLPWLADVEMADYKVRNLAGAPGADALARVLVVSRDREREWTTVGVHTSVVEASMLALCDAVAFAALSHGAAQHRALVAQPPR